MATWINSSSYTGLRNGSPNHDIIVNQPAANSFLLLLVSSPAVVEDIDDSWFLRGQLQNNASLSVYTKVANGTETNIPVVLTSSNYALEARMYEFYQGTSWGGIAPLQQGENPGPNLTGLSGEPTIMFVQAFGVHGTPVATPNPYIDNYNGFTLDYQHYVPNNGVNDGAGIAINYAEHWDSSAISTLNFVSFTSNDLGINGIPYQVRAAFWLIPAEVIVLDTPIVTVADTTDPTEGNSDGSIEITWPPVEGAESYEAFIGNGHNLPPTTPVPLTLVAEGVTSPYLYTGLPFGEYTVGVRAVPPEES
ncbi:MAG TPA: hypothetical protein VHK27_15065 [Gammaproteobacteria bacterium]|nr:hypothetical protein [Gammaproteobacteria bacterium]